LAGAAVTTLAFAEPFIASDAAAAFCFFSAEGKEKLSPPRGHERETSIIAINFAINGTKKIPRHFLTGYLIKKNIN
jgi:hypothetical protein